MSFNYVPPRKRIFKGKKKNVSIGMPEDMIEFFRTLADQSGVTFTDVVLDALDQVAEQVRSKSKMSKQR